MVGALEDLSPDEIRQERTRAWLPIGLATVSAAFSGTFVYAHGVAGALGYSGQLGVPVLQPTLGSLGVAGAGVVFLTGLSLRRSAVFVLFLWVPVALVFLQLLRGPIYQPGDAAAWRAKGLPTAVHEPARAWGLGIFAVLFLGGSVSSIRRLRRLPSTDASHGDAYWSSESQAEALTCRHPGPVLGAYPRRDGKLPTLLTSPEPLTQLVGPPGAGKTWKSLAATLLTYPSSVVVIDKGGELYQGTSGYRNEVLGNEILLFEPFAEETEGRASINLLDLVSPGLSAFTEAALLAEVLVPLSKGGNSESFFRPWGIRLMTALVLHLLHVGPRHLGAMTKLFTSGGSTDYAAGLQQIANADHTTDGPHPFIRDEALAVAALPEDTCGGVCGSALTHMSLYSDPLVGRHLSSSSFLPLDLQDPAKPRSLYIVLPPGRMDRIAPFLRAFWTLLLSNLTNIPLAPGSVPAGDPIRTPQELLGGGGNYFPHEYEAHQRRPLLLALDELFQLKGVPFLEKYAPITRGFGITIVGAWQTTAQALALGDGKIDTLSPLFTSSVFWPSTDTKTAETVTKSVGKATQHYQTRSSSRGKILRGGSSSVSQGEQRSARELLTLPGFMALPEGRTVVLSRSCRPILAEDIPVWKDPRFAEALTFDPATKAGGSVCVSPWEAFLDPSEEGSGQAREKPLSPPFGTGPGPEAMLPGPPGSQLEEGPASSRTEGASAQDPPRMGPPSVESSQSTSSSATFELTF